MTANSTNNTSPLAYPTKTPKEIFRIIWDHIARKEFTSAHNILLANKTALFAAERVKFILTNGRCLQGLPQPKNAINYLCSFPEWKSNKHFLRTIAHCYYDQYDFKNAASTYALIPQINLTKEDLKKLTNREQDFLNIALFYWAKCLINNDNIPEALRIYEKNTDLDLQDFSQSTPQQLSFLYRNLLYQASCFNSINAWEKALGNYQKILTLPNKENNIPALLGCLACYDALNISQEAEKIQSIINSLYPSFSMQTSFNLDSKTHITTIPTRIINYYSDTIEETDDVAIAHTAQDQPPNLSLNLGAETCDLFKKYLHNIPGEHYLFGPYILNQLLVLLDLKHQITPIQNNSLFFLTTCANKNALRKAGFTEVAQNQAGKPQTPFELRIDYFKNATTHNDYNVFIQLAPQGPLEFRHIAYLTKGHTIDSFFCNKNSTVFIFQDTNENIFFEALRRIEAVINDIKTHTLKTHSHPSEFFANHPDRMLSTLVYHSVGFKLDQSIATAIRKWNAAYYIPNFSSSIFYKMVYRNIMTLHYQDKQLSLKYVEILYQYNLLEKIFNLPFPEKTPANNMLEALIEKVHKELFSQSAMGPASTPLPKQGNVLLFNPNINNSNFQDFMNCESGFKAYPRYIKR